jgi:hypothetical protein
MEESERFWRVSGPREVILASPLRYLLLSAVGKMSRAAMVGCSSGCQFTDVGRDAAIAHVPLR